MMTPLPDKSRGSLAAERNISRTITRDQTAARITGRHRRPYSQCESGPGGSAAWIIGPVAVEPGHAPFDALVEAREAAILDDREMHAVNAGIVQRHAAAAVTARNIVGLPGPERDLMDIAVAGDCQRGVPEGAFLFLELRTDGRKRGLAWRHPSLIFRTGQPEIQLQRIGGLGRLAQREQGHGSGTEQARKGKVFEGFGEIAHEMSAER